MTDSEQNEGTLGTELPQNKPEVTIPVRATSLNGCVGVVREKEKGIFSWFMNIVGYRQEPSLREALEEYIEESEDEDAASVTMHERALLSNILALRDMTVIDVMIPRADIVAVEISTSQEDLHSLLTEKQHSRFPVYNGTLDDVVGTIHIKDIIACLAREQRVEIENLFREIPIVSPSMHVLDLMLMMRQARKHMVLVVDEYGGIDGLVTIGDVIEAIIGEIDDEYDEEDQEKFIDVGDGVVLATGRADIDEFEEQYGMVLSDEERDEIDTLGGLVFALAGRVPARGEVLTHPSGIIFEILDADPRRVNHIRIKNLPSILKSK